MRLVFWVVLLSVVPLSVDARSEGWVITARDTTADYFAVAMANGEIGVAVGREPFALGSVILGGSYEPGFGDDVSRILEGINPLGLTSTASVGRYAACSAHDPFFNGRCDGRLSYTGLAEHALRSYDRSGSDGGTRCRGSFFKRSYRSRRVRRHPAGVAHGRM